jgi:transaldolase
VTKLHELYADHGQSPWLDDLSRTHLRGGALRRLIAEGIRGVTSNPTIFARAMSGSSDYDEQFRALMGEGVSVTDAYWRMVVDDITEALAQLRPIHDRSLGGDGFVSIELGPELARDTARSVDAARAFHAQIAEANLLVKIPATPEGVPAIREMTGEGRRSTSRSCSASSATTRSSRHTWPGSRPAPATSTRSTASPPSS